MTAPMEHWCRYDGTDGTLVSLPSGHFAAWEQPELFGTEIRAAFRSLR
jgi:hypothetical protein